MVVAVEVAALVVLAASGWLLLPPNVDGRWRLVAALPVGLAALAVMQLLLLSTRLPVGRPWVAAALALGLAGVFAVRRGTARGQWRHALVGLGIVGVVVAVTAALPLVNVTVDSFRYMSVGRLLTVDGATEGIGASLLQKRGVSTGSFHGLALSDLGYLRALGPLTALSTLGILWLAVREGTSRLPHGLSRWVAVAGILLLVTNHRFLFTAFYVNGHVFVAAWVLLLVVIIWGLSRSSTTVGSVPPLGDGAIAAALVAVALVVTRPEGALLVGLVLAPAVMSPQIDRRWRQQVLAATGVGVVLWHVTLLPLFRDLELSIVGLLGLGLVYIAAAALLGVVDRVAVDRPMLLLHGLVWLVLVVLTLRDPWTLLNSIEATADNVLRAGGWGISLLVLATLTAVAVASRRVPAESAWLFPLFTFVPLGALLALLRGGAFRVGPGDSLNRMIIHVVPLAVLALAMVAIGEPRRWPWSTSRRS